MDPFFPYSDPDVHFCSNEINNPWNPCNLETRYPPANLACHVCSGPLCRESLGNLFKRTCSPSATSCFIAEGINKEIERGCWEEEGSSELCDGHNISCDKCQENYCNDAPAELTHQGHEGHSGEILLLSADPESTRTKRSTALQENVQFSCYQCHSEDPFDKSCDEDVRYLEPTSCAYLYGSRPASCYVLIHRGWKSMERGCGTELDQYMYAACDTDLFAECKLCTGSGCNNQDMTDVLKERNK